MTCPTWLTRCAAPPAFEFLLASEEAASLVGAAMISVLVLPLPAMRLRSADRRAGRAAGARPAPGGVDDSETW
ncbi:hypothetical protein ACIHFC_04730 [Streptomyces sp. NPDC052013]|uniref:hypothetical protein n=1 Tax=Streptomyces sp. NPDC052013 TaxID=3365679 RepID=UPI0037D40A4A